MDIVASRAPRWSRTLVIAAIAVLGACADEPVAPIATPSPNLTPNLAVPGPFVDVTVTNASGGQEVGSLRWAADQIRSGGGVIRFAPALDGATIVLGGSVTPGGRMWVEGPANGITISGNSQYRVIAGYPDDGLVSLNNVTITKGYAPDYASAIRATSLSLLNSTITDNHGPGSAIRVRYGLSATNSTIANNEVGAPAVEYSELSQVTFMNSTIAFNAPGAGIGLYGGTSSAYQLIVTLNNSIISNNGSPAQNCWSTSGLRYEGTNIANDLSCGVVGIGYGDPQLMPLANNGGPTKTLAIQPTSPARNTGVGCFPTTDQRGVIRDAKCDVGAFEFNDSTKVTIRIDPNAKIDAATGQVVLTGSVTCTRNDVINVALELHQDQRVGKKTVDVHAAATQAPIGCGPIAHPWEVLMTLSGGTWQTGSARATGVTFGTSDWIIPASVAVPVKISRR
jgi:hypothetical protein